ncbi:MAG: helix-turn-helix domain-containing protein [Acidobacteriota bacterium]
MSILKLAQKEEAARLVAEGRLDYGEISEKLGLDRKTFYRWRREPAFDHRVEEILAEITRPARRLAIARKAYRLSVLNRLHVKLETLIEQRAKAHSDVVAGGDTGLIVRQFKVSGETEVEEYVFDAAVIREMRAVQEQAAKELGQLVDKHEHKISSLKDLSDEELAALLAEDGEHLPPAGEDSDGTGAPEEGAG